MLTWTDVLAEEKEQPYFIQMMQLIAEKRAEGIQIYPPKELVFHAFAVTPFEDVKVVILGQDPYHGPGQAHGLCFSVEAGIKHPPSLVNIFKELERDIEGFARPLHGDLNAWARQGVLLLNTVLTVEQGQAHSHANIGWETFTDKVIDMINVHKDDVIFLLWGGHAQRKAKQVDIKRHKVLCAPHPSPLSAHRGFIGCGHFSEVNEHLIASGKHPIQWHL